MRNLCFFSIGIYNITVVSICHPITLILTIQEYCPRCRIIINTDSQQFADGSNWQIVGFTAGDISIENGRRRFLSVCNGNIRTCGNLFLAIQSNIGEIICYFP